MRKRFHTIHDYHRLDPDIRVEEADIANLRVSLLHERSGDVHFTRTNRHGLVLTLDGSRTHLTRMDGIRDESPSRRGEVCLIPAGIDVHLAWTNHGPIQKSIMVEFDADLFRRIAPEIANDRFLDGHLIPGGFAARTTIAELMRVLAREAIPARAQGRLFAEAAIRLLAFEIASTAWSRPVSFEPAAARPDPRMARVIDYIEAAFAEDISVIDMAALAGLSPTQFTRAFRASTGRTPYAYVLDRRLSQAIRLILQTDLPLAVIAIESGFADQAHMTRMMRARHGRTPQQIRSER